MNKNVEFGKTVTKTFVRKMFFSVIYVMMLTSIISTIVVLIQGICIQNFMGEYGDLATGAEGIGVPIFAFGTFFCYTLGFGLQIISSRIINSNKKDEIASYFTANMILSLATAIIFLLIGCLWSRQISELLGAGSGRSQNPQLELKFCEQNIRGYFWGFCFQCLFRSFHPSIYLDKAKKYAYISTAAMLVTAIVGFLLISYYVPMEEKMLWYGFMTTFAYASGILVFGLYFLIRNKKALFRFKFKGLKARHFGLLFQYGTPSGLRKLSFAFYILVLNLIMMWIDPTHIATQATSCLTHYQTLFVVIPSGIYYSCATMSSYFTALKDKRYFDEFLRFISLVCFAVMTVVGLILIGVAAPLVDLYGAGIHDGVVYWSTVSAIRWYVGSLPFITFGGVWLSVYQGANNNKWMYASIIWQDFFPLVFVALFGYIGSQSSLEMGRYMLWIGQFFGPIAVLIVHFFLGWIVNHGKPFSADAIFFLEKEKLYKPENVIWFNYTNKKQQLAFKSGLEQFCKQNKISIKAKNNALTIVNKLFQSSNRGAIKTKPYVSGVRIAKDQNRLIISYVDTMKHIVLENKQDKYLMQVDALKHKYNKLLFSDTFNMNEYTLDIAAK